MRKLVYSPTYKNTMLELKEYLDSEFGIGTRKKVLSRITKRLHLLKQDAYTGVSLRNMYGINTDFRYIFIEHSYIFYRVDEKTVYIVNIYHEKEDYMRSLFGIIEVPDDED